MHRSLVGLLGALALLVAAMGSPRLGSAEEISVNRITQVQPGMTMMMVLQTLGPPSDIDENTFYYKELGKVIFEGKGSPLDETKVLKIEPSTIQPAVP